VQSYLAAESDFNPNSAAFQKVPVPRCGPLQIMQASELALSVRDAIADRICAGEPVEEVAADYHTTVAVARELGHEACGLHRGDESVDPGPDLDVHDSPPACERDLDALGDAGQE
jgi:hypothetical protein